MGQNIKVKNIWDDAGLLREELTSVYFSHFDGKDVWLNIHNYEYTEEIISRISKLTNIQRKEITKIAIQEVRGLYA